MILSSEAHSVSTVLLPSVVGRSFEAFGHLFDTHHLEDFYRSGRIFSQSSAMSSMPYAMRMAKSEKKRQYKQSQETGCADGSAGVFTTTNFENPTMYSSKMMNSIWGMYNKYSVHNFKSKQCDPSLETSSSGLGGSSTFSQTNASTSGSDGPYKCSGYGSPSFDFSSMANDVAVGIANAMTKFH